MKKILTLVLSIVCFASVANAYYEHFSLLGMGSNDWSSTSTAFPIEQPIDNNANTRYFRVLDLTAGEHYFALTSSLHQGGIPGQYGPKNNNEVMTIGAAGVFGGYNGSNAWKVNVPADGLYRIVLDENAGNDENKEWFPTVMLEENTLQVQRGWAGWADANMERNGNTYTATFRNMSAGSKEFIIRGNNKALYYYNSRNLTTANSPVPLSKASDAYPNFKFNLAETSHVTITLTYTTMTQVDVQVSAVSAVLPDPETAPDAPNVPAVQVRSVMSSTYTSAVEDGFNTSAWGSSAINHISSTLGYYVYEMSNAVIIWGADGGNVIKAKEGFNDGTNVGLDASNMEYLHVDVWCDHLRRPTFFVNDGNLGAQSTTVENGWKSYDIAISSLATGDRGVNNVRWMKFDGFNTGDIVVLANVFFYTTQGTDPVTSISLDRQNASLYIGDKLTLTPTITPSSAGNKNVLWTTNASSVATVVDGVVTAEGIGSATITAKTEDGEFTATCLITVTADPTLPAVAAPTVIAAGIDIRAIYTDDVALALENEFSINAYGNAPYAKKVINGNNYIIYTAEGGNTVTSWGRESGASHSFIAKAGYNDGEHTGIDARDMAYLHLDIWANAPANGIHIQNDNDILGILNHDGSGWKSFDIDITSKAAGLNNVHIFKFAGLPTDTKVAFDNVYFWKADGTAPVTSVTLNKTTATLEVGENITLISTVLPSIAGNKTVTWSSSNEDIATVTNGVVNAVAAGEATITVETEDGNFTANCVITVYEPQTAHYYGSVSGTATHCWLRDGAEGAIFNDFPYTIYYDVIRNSDRSISVESYLESDPQYPRTSGFVYQVVDYVGGTNFNSCVKNETGVHVAPTHLQSAIGENAHIMFRMAYNAGESTQDLRFTVGAESAPYIRPVTANKYGTLCLPFNAVVEGVTLYTVSSASADALMLRVVESDSEGNVIAEAGKGYIFKALADGQLKATYTAVAAHGTNPGLVGNIAPFTLTTDATAETSTIYVMSNNQLRKLVAGGTVKMGENRAYLDLSTLETPMAAAPSVLRIVENEDTATDLDLLQVNKAEKFFENGQLYILKNGQLYDVTGRLVR